MSPETVEPLLQPWMERQRRRAPEGLLLRVMTEVDTMSQDSPTLTHRLFSSPAAGWFGAAVAVVALTAAFAVFGTLLHRQPATTASPSPRASAAADGAGLRNPGLEGLLPPSHSGEPLELWSINRSIAELALWFVPISVEADADVLMYAVASEDGGIGYATTNRADAPYVSGGPFSGITVRVLVFANQPTTDVLEAFGRAYVAAMSRLWLTNDPRCTSEQIYGHEALACSDSPSWEEHVGTWYVFVDGPKLFLVSGIDRDAQLHELVQSLPWSRAIRPEPPAGSRTRDIGLETLLPDSVDGMQLHKWSLSAGGVALVEWLQDIGARAGSSVRSYAVARNPGTDLVRGASRPRYIDASGDAGPNHDVRIHALAFSAAGRPDELLAVFEASFKDEVGVLAECRDVTTEWTGGRRVRWCFESVQGERTSWYAYAHRGVLFLIEGVGDLEGVGTSPVSLRWFQEIVAALPTQD